MAGRRVVPVLATLGVVGGGYYLYTAGGDPKVAKKEIERKGAMRTVNCDSLLTERYDRRCNGSLQPIKG